LSATIFSQIPAILRRGWIVISIDLLLVPNQQSSMDRIHPGTSDQDQAVSWRWCFREDCMSFEHLMVAGDLRPFLGGIISWYENFSDVP